MREGDVVLRIVLIELFEGSTSNHALFLGLLDLVHHLLRGEEALFHIITGPRILSEAIAGNLRLNLSQDVVAKQLETTGLVVHGLQQLDVLSSAAEGNLATSYFAASVA